jgi:hypothetical protein
VGASRERHVFRGIGIAILAVAVMIGVVYWAGKILRPAPTPPSQLCWAQVGGDSTYLEPDQARNASIIAAVAAQRDLVARATTIGLATAIQESGLRALDYGDRDSLGLFQQRPSMGWGTAEEVQDPYYSSGKFFEVMETVDGWQTADIGDVAQEVQRSGFPDAYDDHVDEARLLASALSGQTPQAWSCVVRDLAAPDPDRLATALTQGYGARLEVQTVPAGESTSAQLKLSAPSDAIAWSAAAFAQSWATITGVASVSVGSHQWTAAADKLPQWTTDSTNAQPTTAVTVTFRTS